MLEGDVYMEKEGATGGRGNDKCGHRSRVYIDPVEIFSLQYYCTLISLISCVGPVVTSGYMETREKRSFQALLHFIIAIN